MEKSIENSRNRSDFVLSNGAIVEVKMGIDNLGMRVIRKLEINFPNDKAIPTGGITAILLREIRLEDLLKLDSKNSSVSNLADEKIVIKFIKDEFARPTNAYSEVFYAYLSWLYVNFSQKFPTSPSSKLSEVLDIPRKTLVGRITKARSIGMISDSDFVYSATPTGKSGGILSSKAIKVIKENKLGK